MQQRQTAEAAAAELRQSLQQEQKKTAALAQEVSAARQAMAASVEQQRRALDEAQLRAAVLTSELDGTRREIETQAARAKKADDAATRQREAAERTIAELRQSLQQERDKTGTAARDLAAARPSPDQRATLGRAPDRPPIAGDAQGKSEAARLIARAGALLNQGNIGAARIVLERAVESGNVQAGDI